jgi:hypothetical protein
VPPTQGVLLVIAGVGKGKTETVATAVFVHPSTLVTKTVYCPFAVRDALGIDGFCADEEKPAGPVHAKAVPPVAVRLMVWFKQTVGLFTVIEGNGLTVTDMLATFVQVLTSVTRTE